MATAEQLHLCAHALSADHHRRAAASSMPHISTSSRTPATTIRGLALCKNAHWLFDNGLWTLTDDYKVIVAEGHFAEDGPDKMLLREYNGKRIHLPTDTAHWPNPVHIAWHRQKRFKRP